MIRIQTPENTGLEKNLYTITLKTGEVDKTMEKMFSMIEGATKSTIDALVTGKTIGSQQREEMAFFMALLATRTPDMIEGTQRAIDKGETLMMREHWNEEGRTAMINAGYTVKEVEQFDCEIRDGEISVRAPEGWALAISISQAQHIMPLLIERRWIVIHAKSRKYGFVTSDVPVILTSKAKRPSGFGCHSVGFAHEDAVVILPLSNDTALVAQDSGYQMEHRTVGQRRVDEINELMAAIFQRFAIGRSRRMMNRWCIRNNYPKGREKGDRIEVREISIRNQNNSSDADKALHWTTSPGRVLRPFSLG